MARPPWPAVGPARRAIGKLLLAILGWRREGAPPDLPQAVFIAAPHTSYWDMPLMLAVSWSLGIRPTWFGKDTVFRFPLGTFMRALGGVPVDRDNRRDRVQFAVTCFERGEPLYLVISPPGTRRKTDHWRSGFYQIARLANVPVCCAFLDFSRKVGGIGPTLDLSGDVKRDMEPIRAFYDPIQPKHPENRSTIRLKAEEGGESLP